MNDNNNELIEYILNEQNVDDDTSSVDLTNDELEDLIESSNDNVVFDDTPRQRRLRRQCPDFFDVVTPDYDVVDGAYIKNLRESINVTKKVFAQIVGVAEDTVDDWEDDVKRPNNCALRLLYLLNNHIKLTTDLFNIQMKRNNNSKA